MARKRHYDKKKAVKSVGLKVRSLRNLKGWTLEECEMHGPINWKYLQDIESGRNVTVSTLVTLANLFGVHPSELLQDI